MKPEEFDEFIDNLQAFLEISLDEKTDWRHRNLPLYCMKAGIWLFTEPEKMIVDDHLNPEWLDWYSSRPVSQYKEQYLEHLDEFIEEHNLGDEEF